MTWVLASLAVAFFTWVAIEDHRRISRIRRCTTAAQERLEREIAERGEA